MLIDQIYSLTDELVIITKYDNDPNKNSHIPAILKSGDTFKVYTSLSSQFTDYKLGELIDYFMKFVDTDIEHHFELVDKDEFEKIRLETLKNDIKIKDTENNENDNFNIIKKELEIYGGSYVITPSNEIKFLIGACTTDEDYYYIFLTLSGHTGLGINLNFESCVGGFIPLIDNLLPKYYKRIQSFVINETIETLDPKTLRPGNEILRERIESMFEGNTEYVLFTPIYLFNKIRDEPAK